MATNYPDWATEKQREGMSELHTVADEYGNFELEFYQSQYDDEGYHRFSASVSWGYEDISTGRRTHYFDIAFGYEQTWDRCGQKMEPYWQFLFAGGEATREISTEVFFLDLFHYLDEIAVTKPNLTAEAAD